MSKAAIATIASVVLAVLAEAGYVDLYRDANFKHKLTRVDDVVLDACYRFTCKDLDNAITSAKWHGLPETGSFFEGGLATIAFFTGADCNETAKHWYIETQSKKDRYFPENFRLDGMNDAISSFMVLNIGGHAGTMNVCQLPESGDAANATVKWGSSSNSGSADEKTIQGVEEKSSIIAWLNDSASMPPTVLEIKRDIRDQPQLFFADCTTLRDTPVNMTAVALRTAMLFAITPVGIVQAGYVDFYRDADFEHKITRIKPVQVDTCYNLGCFGLDDAVTSAKWGELPERTFKDAFTKIEFYTSRGCTSKHKAWLVKTQSDSDLHFPKNFKADGINDAISSFMVVKEGKGDNEEYVCSESGNFLSTNSSIDTK